MQINPIFSLSCPKTYEKADNNTRQVTVQHQKETVAGLRSRFNDHMLAFKARVDKGLDRFYETNKTRMPFTVKRYVEALEDKSRLSPLQAQQRAFYKLKEVQTVDDIKKSFPDEELFANLKNPKDCKATRGILNSVKENQELMELYDKDVLKDKKVFVTVDLDVLDTSIMPGTGTPEAGGFQFNELMGWFEYLKNFDIVGADVVELAPDYDASGASTAVATKVIRELLMIM